MSAEIDAFVSYSHLSLPVELTHIGTPARLLIHTPMGYEIIKDKEEIDKRVLGYQAKTEPRKQLERAFKHLKPLSVVTLNMLDEVEDPNEIIATLVYQEDYIGNIPFPRRADLKFNFLPESQFHEIGHVPRYALKTEKKTLLIDVYAKHTYNPKALAVIALNRIIEGTFSEKFLF
jgi:hypothetical protein